MPAYIGVNGKAKAIAKVYVGNSSGKAELIWGPRGPNRYSKNVTGLKTARYSLSGNEIDDYALFAGGLTKASSTSNAVDAYDKTLTRTTPTALSVGRYGMASAKNYNYAIFAGGEGYSNVVDAYNTSLTRSTPTVLSVGRKASAACGNNGDIVVAGGNTSSGYSKVVDLYDHRLTRSNTTSLSEARSNLVAVCAGSFILFAGGYNGSKYVSTVDAFNIYSSKIDSVKSGLSEEKAGCAAVSLDDKYGIIAGGGNLSRSNTVDIYNDDLVKSIAATLTKASTNIVATTLRDEYALFCGFADSKYSIDAYDYNLTKVFVQFGVTRASIAAASVGDYSLFAGGTFNSVSQSTVDAFHIFE